MGRGRARGEDHAGLKGLLGEAFRIIDSGSFTQSRIIEIKPQLLFMPNGTGDKRAR